MAISNDTSIILFKNIFISLEKLDKRTIIYRQSRNNINMCKTICNDMIYLIERSVNNIADLIDNSLNVVSSIYHIILTFPSEELKYEMCNVKPNKAQIIKREAGIIASNKIKEYNAQLEHIINRIFAKKQEFINWDEVRSNKSDKSDNSDNSDSE